MNKEEDWRKTVTYDNVEQQFSFSSVQDFH